ncbi:hypothetical protein TrVE_jg11969 [Triparma verrucosa]|uniref:Uncharacterized protein n=1 Tax=Triparma verrucosa TaxID=1606542 RepID=A0A9W7CA65_9STRA|nr:hypothetical protein TrVE_jg11969 [Triparma verrucosa]
MWKHIVTLLLKILFIVTAVSPLSLQPPTVLSQNPLALCFDNFASESECAELLTDRWRSSHTFTQVTSRVGSLVGVPPHRNELLRRTTSTVSSQSPLELHTDTNNGRLACFATAILYLTTVPPGYGGHTSLPLADASSDDFALLSAANLVSQNIHHASMASPHDASVLEAAASACSEGGIRGVRCRPVEGRLFLFYGRDASGAVDPRAFHRGDPLDPHFKEAKVIIPFLKELPMDDVVDEEDFKNKISALVKEGMSLI